MSKTLEDGFEELKVHVSRTIQIKEFEPLKISASLKKMVKPNEVSDTIREVTELMEDDINMILGIGDENPSD